MYSFPLATASRMEQPFAKKLAIAEDRVHPVPCALRVYMNGFEKRWNESSSAMYSTSTAFSLPIYILPTTTINACPPFTSTAPQPSRHNSRADSFIPSTVCSTGRPSSNSV